MVLLVVVWCFLELLVGVCVVVVLEVVDCIVQILFDMCVDVYEIWCFCVEVDVVDGDVLLNVVCDLLLLLFGDGYVWVVGEVLLMCVVCQYLIGECGVDKLCICVVVYWKCGVVVVYEMLED